MQAPQIKMETVLVTPEVAKEWLSRSKNRPLNRVHVRQIATEMREGRFDGMTGDCFVFDTDGNFRNGQHRAQAVINTGMSFFFPVLRGASPDAFEKMDIGRRRSAGDTFALHGINNGIPKAAIVRHMRQYDQNGIIGREGPGEIASNAERVRLYFDHVEEVEAAYIVASRVSGQVPQAASSVVGVAWIVFARIDRDAADRFFASFRTGAELLEGDPILALRRRFFRPRGSGHKGIEVWHQLAWFIKAWNYWRLNRKTSVIMWRDDEDFPVPV